MLDFAQARRMMVDSQLRTFDVNDLPLLDAMDETPRERFVPRHLESIAYIDQDLPLSEGEGCRYILSPMIQGRLIQALAIDTGAKVLDVACGLGYSSAILAALGAKVVALESSEILAASARQCLAGSGAQGVKIACGPLEQGFPSDGPYDAVLINGAVEKRPDALLQQLSEGGRLICVFGRGRSAKATLYVRSGEGIGARALFDAAAPLLSSFRAEAGFVF
jgi:protein-L-isoaspartate(D-aspartate) O-methyltransferase